MDCSFTKASVEQTVYHGTYAMIESISVTDKDFKKSQHKEKFAGLKQSLTDQGLSHCQIIGCYEGEKTKYSCFVVKPSGIDLTKFRQIIYDLGKQFGQESVIISSNNKVELIFTTGEKVNQACYGEGFKKQKGDNYSKIRTSDGKKFYIGEYKLNRKEFFNWPPEKGDMRG
jgi:hypothetical protein